MSDETQKAIDRIRARFENPEPETIVTLQKTITLPMPSSDKTVCDYLKIVREVIQEHEAKDSYPGRRVVYSVQVGGLIFSLDRNNDFRIRFADDSE